MILTSTPTSLRYDEWVGLEKSKTPKDPPFNTSTAAAAGRENGIGLSETSPYYGESYYHCKHFQGILSFSFACSISCDSTGLLGRDLLML